MLVFERDLGTSLLFFGIFVVMLYIATERTSWLLIGVLLFARRRRTSPTRCSATCSERVDIWLHPFAPRRRHGDGYQLVQGLFGFGTGGLLGTGLGQGRPDIVPFAKTDFIVAAIGEELGLDRRHGDPRALRHRRRSAACGPRWPSATPSASCWPPGSRSASRCRSSSSSAASPG